MRSAVDAAAYIAAGLTISAILIDPFQIARGAKLHPPIDWLSNKVRGEGVPFDQPTVVLWA